MLFITQPLTPPDQKSSMFKHFSIHDFIVNSNLIDPQPDIYGDLIPGTEPGEPMYVRQEEAFAFVQTLAEEKVSMDKNVILDIHRLLTRGIDFFEERGMSGLFRKVNVWIGKPGSPGHIKFAEVYCIAPLIAHFCKEWNERVEALGDKPTKKAVWEQAYFLHDFFETIHPFIDGNGRTGRLLLCLFCMRFKVDPMLIWYKTRHKYYDNINLWRANEYPAIFDKAMPKREE